MKIDTAIGTSFLMLSKFISITGTCISPETDFPSAYIFILTVKTVVHIIRSILGVFSFVENLQPNLSCTKENILKREACENNRLQLHPSCLA